MRKLKTSENYLLKAHGKVFQHLIEFSLKIFREVIWFLNNYKNSSKIPFFLH